MRTGVHGRPPHPPGSPAPSALLASRGRGTPKGLSTPAGRGKGRVGSGAAQRVCQPLLSPRGSCATPRASAGAPCARLGVGPRLGAPTPALPAPRFGRSWTRGRFSGLGAGLTRVPASARQHARESARGLRGACCRGAPRGPGRGRRPARGAAVGQRGRRVPCPPRAAFCRGENGGKESQLARLFGFFVFASQLKSGRLGDSSAVFTA